MPEVTHAIVPNSKMAMDEATSRQMSARGPITLSTGDDIETTEVIYIYNILDMEHIVEQPPLFAHVLIPRCPKGREFIWTLVPRYVNEVYNDYTKNERYYKRIDGRMCATSLLNPAVHPRTPWEGQFQDIKTQGDQAGNNLNAYGCFWSLTKPGDAKLKDELKLSKDRVRRTMNELVSEGEKLNASNQLSAITPRMHFAMDYLGLQARWHMSHEHMVSCPNCGESIREGLSYHRNVFGEKCIIDRERYLASLAPDEAPSGDEPETEKKSRRGKQAA